MCPISDAVTVLTTKYGGLLWGEHGKGVRSEYVPEYFGPLYPALQRLKAALDPPNQLNPSKIATSLGADATLLNIDGILLRGELDRRIDERVWLANANANANADAVNCNGNGARYNFGADDAPVMEGDTRACQVAKRPSVAHARMVTPAAGSGNRPHGVPNGGIVAGAHRQQHAQAPGRAGLFP